MLRIGVLGCADIAVRRTLPAVAEVDGLELTAVAARDADRARRCAGEFGAAPVTGYDALLRRTDVDAVYVPLPAGLHAQWAERALRAGKHVLVEKPLATTRSDVDRVLAVADSAGLVARENMMFVHHRVHGEVRALVADGVIGALRGITAEFTVPPRPAGDIRLSRDLGGGSLLDQGVYPLRAALLHLGGRLEVAGAELRHDPATGVDLAGRARLTTPGGLTADVVFGMTGPYRAWYRLTGTAGSITVQRPYTPPDDHRPVVEIERHGAVRRRQFGADRQFARALESFAAAVRAGRDDPALQLASRRQARLVDRVRAEARLVGVR